MPDPEFNPVLLLSAQIDEREVNGQVSIVFRGIVAPQSLRDLQVDDYQREVISRKKVQELKRVLATDRVPDVELGMRGESYREDKSGLWLLDPVFIIDGLQRVTGGRLLHEDQSLSVEPHLGATVFLNTDRVWERKRFQAVNLGQTRVSPNVSLYNMRHDVEVVLVLHRLTENRQFVLHGKVTWAHNKKRGELLTANGFLKTVGRLHSHTGPGGGSNDILGLAAGLHKIHERIGRTNLIANVKLFFDVVDKCWGVQNVAYREGAVHMRENFLRALALLFSRHLDFWDDKDNRLVLDTSASSLTMRRLSSFPTTDPHVQALSSSSGKAADLLLQLMIDHMNNGRRSGRLKPRTVIENNFGDGEEDGE